MITWVLLKVITKKAKDIAPVMWVAFFLFALRLGTLAYGIGFH